MKHKRIHKLIRTSLALLILASGFLACAVSSLPVSNNNNGGAANTISTFSAGSNALVIQHDAILMEENLYGNNADTYNPLSPAFQVASTYWLKTLCEGAIHAVPVTLAYSWRSLSSTSCSTTPNGHSIVDPGNYLYCTNRDATPSPCTHDGSLQSSAFVAGVFATLGTEPYFQLPFVTPAEEYWSSYKAANGWTEISPSMIQSKKNQPQIGDIVAFAPPTVTGAGQTTTSPNESGHVAIVVAVEPPQGNTNGYLILAGAGQSSNVPASALQVIHTTPVPTRGNFYKVEWNATNNGDIIEPFNNEAFQGLIRFIYGPGAAYAQSSSSSIGNSDCSTYHMAWSDDFNGPANTAPSQTKWNYEITDTPDNNELEHYVNSTQNSYLDGQGDLVIQPLETSPNYYTSARLYSKKDFTYGCFTARIKLARGGQGIWPAFWILGDNGTIWPYSGEADIMENFGHDMAANSSSIHMAVSATDLTEVSRGYGTSPASGTLADAYHIYTLQWSSTQFTFYLDGKKYYTITKSPANPGVTDGPQQTTPASYWDFDHQFYIILNVAVGGDSTGSPTATTFSTPQKMFVDYVRVYQQ